MSDGSNGVNNAGYGKLAGAGTGMGTGSAIAVLIISLFWPDCTANAAIALTTVCNVVVGLAGVYFAPHALTGGSP